MHLDHVAVGEAVPQRDDLSVHFRADALIADFGVHGVGKIHGSRAARKREHFSLRRERVHFLGVQVHLQRGHEFRRLLHFLDPFDQLAHPQNALIVRVGNVLAVLVPPVRGDALFGDAMHFLRADLHFKRLSGVDHRRVQRLVEVRPGHGDVILEPAGHGPPHLMDHAERRVAVADGVRNHAHGQQVVNLIDRAVLAQTLLVNGIEALHAAVDFGGNSVFVEALANRVLQFREKSLEFFSFGDDGILQLLVSLGLEVAESNVLQLAADQTHSQAVRDRGINIERFAGDALLLFGREETERAHVVQPVGQLHHDDAHVVHHGQQHLPDVFSLARFGSQQVQPVDFRDAFDERGDVRPKALGDALRGDARVLDHVVQERGAERRDVQLHVRQNVRDFQGMRQVGVARLAQLGAVLLCGKVKRPPQELNVARGARLPHFFDQLEEAHLQGLGRALRLAANANERRESYGLFQRRHVLVF